MSLAESRPSLDLLYLVVTPSLSLMEERSGDWDAADLACTCCSTQPVAEMPRADMTWLLPSCCASFLVSFPLTAAHYIYGDCADRGRFETTWSCETPLEHCFDPLMICWFVVREGNLNAEALMTGIPTFVPSLPKALGWPDTVVSTIIWPSLLLQSSLPPWSALRGLADDRGMMLWSADRGMQWSRGDGCGRAYSGM